MLDCPVPLGNQVWRIYHGNIIRRHHIPLSAHRPLKLLQIWYPLDLLPVISVQPLLIHFTCFQAWLSDGPCSGKIVHILRPVSTVSIALKCMDLASMNVACPFEKCVRKWHFKRFWPAIEGIHQKENSHCNQRSIDGKQTILFHFQGKLYITTVISLMIPVRLIVRQRRLRTPI